MVGFYVVFHLGLRPKGVLSGFRRLNREIEIEESKRGRRKEGKSDQM